MNQRAISPVPFAARSWLEPEPFFLKRELPAKNLTHATTPMIPPACSIPSGLLIGLGFLTIMTAGLEAEDSAPTGAPKILTDWQTQISIPPPPADSSERTSKDLAELHKMELQRDPETVAQIVAEQTLSGFNLNGTSYRDLSKNSPEMKRLLDLVRDEVQPIAFAIKKRYERIRPSTFDPTLKPCIPNPGHSSYPSEHAAHAFGFAYLFSAVDPDNTGEYFQRASEIAIRREEAGVHFGSDTRAGKELARQVYLALRNQPAYEQQLKAARLEFYNGTLPDEFQPARDPYEILAERERRREKTAEIQSLREAPAKKAPGFLRNFIDKFGKK